MPFFNKKKDKSSATVGTAKPTHRRTSSSVSRSSNVSVNSLDNGEAGSGAGVKDVFIEPGLLLPTDDLDETGDLGARPKTEVRTTSRLSKTLTEIVHNRDALPVFINFMESRKADRFIRFWLDAESFQVATLTRNRTHSLKSVRSGSDADQHKLSTKLNLEILSNQSNASSPDIGSLVTEHTSLTDDLSNTMDSTPECVNTVQTSQTSATTKLNIVQSSENSVTKSKPDSDHSLNQDNSLSNSKPGIVNSVIMQNSISSDNGVGEYCSINQSDQTTTQPKNIQPDTPTIDIDSKDCDNVIINSDNNESVTESSRKHFPNANQSPVNPESSTSNQTCDNFSSKNRHVSEPTSHGENLAGSSPKHRHLSDSSDQTKPFNNVKTKTGLSKEDIKEKLKKSIARDAVNIFTKYISQDASHSIGVPDKLRNESIRSICREDGEVDPECFNNCQQFVLDIIQKDHFPAFQGSEYHCKHQVDILTSGTVYLADILFNEMAIFYFTEFLEQEEISHLLQFWMAVDNFQKHLLSQEGGYDGLEAQNDAMVFYDKYFSLQASQPLGFDDKTRFEVESNICREGGPLPDVFSKPRDIVLYTLEKVYFDQFLKSEIYYKYLSDLITTVNMAQDLPAAKRKRTGSDASSEHSGGSQSVGADSLSHRNTLLAVNSSSIKKAFNKLDVDMSIDDQLLNPEELWKRPCQNKMSLGSMDSFGQFVSEFTPEPDHKEKKQSFFKKSRLKEKEQEEMALQIAQMILNDVATMTKTGDIFCGSDSTDKTDNL